MTAQMYKPMAGEHIKEAAAKVVQKATALKVPFVFQFNGVELAANPSDDPQKIVNDYHWRCEQRRIEYERSPEGIAAAERQLEARKKAAAAEAEGMLPFTVSNQDAFEADVNANKNDDYGLATLRYGARWANYMEREIANGLSVAEAAEKTQFEADMEGITGAMHGFAIGFLLHCWAHAEELRKWKQSN